VLILFAGIRLSKMLRKLRSIRKVVGIYRSENPLSQNYEEEKK